MPEIVVAMKSIEKSFNQNKVLHGVDFSLEQGSIHALLGENGTGKSTLMNILGGVIPCDKGEILIDGEPVTENSPLISKQRGIAFIHQELTLVNDLAVYENLFLGREPKRGICVDRKTMCARAKEVLGRMDVELEPETVVGELNASYKQIVEIGRALLENARVIIMDEPTSSLTDVEIEHMFRIMRALREKGVSFVFISHKLNEVVEICDHYTVMRDGRVVADGAMSGEITENFLARHMVGKELSGGALYRPRPLGDVILELKKLSREREFSDVDMTVRQGEIVGVTGLLGDGRSELFATVFGCNAKYGGEIRICGRPVRMNSTMKAREMGIAYVPRNRKENGIIKDLSVGHNISVSILYRLRRLLLIDERKECACSERYVKSLNIRVADIGSLITSLSGGNQQKAVLAKALASDPRLIILDNPTQGVDIGAKLEIYQIILRLAEEGVSFVVLSSEAQEILMLCDRMYVMFHGKVRAELERGDASEENIMVLATGGSL